MYLNGQILKNNRRTPARYEQQAMNEHHDTIGGKLGSDESIENQLRVQLKATCTSLAKGCEFCCNVQTNKICVCE